MAQSLNTLVRQKTQDRVEDNLETGQVFVFSHGTMYTPMCGNGYTGFCWKAPGTGTAVIELWGAGGSGAKMCCCGGGTPGNAGAYVRKTISVNSSTYICGCPGMSCGNADALCYRGCSDPTGVTWLNGTGVIGPATACLCAQGGNGGLSWCSTSTAMYCCMGAAGWCTTYLGTGCGIVCNYCSGMWIACGYGGDINCCGRFSCITYYGCLPSCICLFQYHIATPSNYYSCGCGGIASFATENDNRHSNWSGQGINQQLNAVAAMSRQPTVGIPQSYCWRSDRKCGCYQMQGCMNYNPPGVGGVGPAPCPDVRDSAMRGGMGAVRIRFF